MTVGHTTTMFRREAAGAATRHPLDANLPFVHLIWATSDLAEVLNGHVLPVVRPGHRIVSIEQKFVHWTPGLKCTALFELQLDDSVEKRPLRVLLSFDKDYRLLEEACAAQNGHEPNMPDAPPPFALFLREYRCLVEISPHDWKLPSLARAMSAEDILPVLAPVLGDDIALQTWRCEIRELGYRPHNRAVLHYSAHGPNRGDRREFIGKIHRKTSRAAKAFANHSQIHASAADGGLIVPEPIMFVEDLNLMIMERVQGALLHDMLLAPSEANPAGETLRIAARALASYHALPYQGRDARPLARRLKRMRQRVAALHAVDAELAPSYEPLLDRIERRAAACDVVSTCLIHGDFTPHQLILTDRGTALVDFDGVGLGDPAIDVGSFMAKCRTMERLQGKDGASWTAEKFLGEYLALTNSDAELAERARICCAWKLISNAVHEYFKAPRRHAHASRSSLHTILLEEVAACLAS